MTFMVVTKPSVVVRTIYNCRGQMYILYSSPVQNPSTYYYFYYTCNIGEAMEAVRPGPSNGN